jgi:hypothetical protein
MPTQDASRFHVFNLVGQPAGTSSAPVNLDGLELIGRALLRRLVQHYPRLRREILPDFTARLLHHGFPRRAADLYASLLGCAEAALYDETSTERLDAWCAHRFMKDILGGVLGDQTAEWLRCWAYLCSSRADPREATGVQVGELLARVAASLRRSPHGQAALMGGEDAAMLDPDSDAAQAHARLLAIGLRLVWRPIGGDMAPGLALYVANQHRGLAVIFEQTPWQTIPQAAGGGGWTHVLRRMPGAAAAGKMVYFRAGVQSRALVLPVERLLPAEAPAADPEWRASYATEGRPN